MGPNKQDGTFTSAPTWAAGPYSNPVLDFNGTTDYVTIDSDGSEYVYINTGRAHTISVICRLDAFPDATSYPVICELNCNGSDAYELFFSNNATYDDISFGNDNDFVKASVQHSAPTGTWMHIIFTYNGSGATTLSNFAVYIDGQSETTATTGVYSNATNRTLIGSKPDGSDYYWNGPIEHLMIWEREFSALEAQLLYQDPYGMFRWDIDHSYIFAAAAAGRTTKNTDAFTLGVSSGISFRMVT